MGAGWVTLSKWLSPGQMWRLRQVPTRSVLRRWDSNRGPRCPGSTRKDADHQTRGPVRAREDRRRRQGDGLHTRTASRTHMSKSPVLGSHSSGAGCARPPGTEPDAHGQAQAFVRLGDPRRQLGRGMRSHVEGATEVRRRRPAPSAGTGRPPSSRGEVRRRSARRPRRHRTAVRMRSTTGIPATSPKIISADKRQYR